MCIRDRGILDGGIYSNGMMNQYDWTVRNQINYNFTLNEKHNFNIDLGQEAKSTIYKGSQGSVFPGYMPEEGKTFTMFPMISPGDVYESVSYTHLDVYKRQGVNGTDSGLGRRRGL